MAPVVHGFEDDATFMGRVDFVYLNVADPRNADAKRALGFQATPHFFFRRADGSAVESMQGVVPPDSVRQALDRLLATILAPAAR